MPLPPKKRVNQQQHTCLLKKRQKLCLVPAVSFPELTEEQVSLLVLPKSRMSGHFFGIILTVTLFLLSLEDLIWICAIVYPLDRVAGVLASYIALRGKLQHVSGVDVIC